MTRHLLFLLIMLLTVSACTVTPDGPQHAVNLSAQLQQVAKVQQWELRGKMAFRQGKEAASANISWETDGDDFNFRLTNLLGITLVHLVVDDDLATLEADGETYKDAIPEPLIYYATGMAIPVAPLLSWIKGMPLANDSYQLNDKGLLASLESQCNACEGWQVTYGNYGNVATPTGGDIWLPHAITLTQESPLPINEAPSNKPVTTVLKIKIYQWTLP